MNNLYIKKAVVIEAFQITRQRRRDNSEWPNWPNWPNWLHLAWQKEIYDVGSVSPLNYPNSDGNDMLIIQTLKGVHKVNWGDYIIQGVNGELYPCDPVIFEITYDKVEEEYGC